MKSNSVLFLVITLLNCTKPNSNSIQELTDSLPKSNADISRALPGIDTTHYDYDNYFQLESYLIKDKLEDKEFEIIDFDCAILIYPTDEQIDEMKKEFGEDFYTIADDNLWYQAQAIGIIDSMHVKQFSTTDRFIRFEGKNNNWDLDIRKKNLPAWNLIFFKKTKEPKIISTIDVNVESVKQYFDL